MATIATVHRVLARLRLSDDPDDAVLAEAIGDFLSGIPFHRALGLPSNWRDAGRAQARDAALHAMEALLLQLPARQCAAGIPAAIRAGSAARCPRDGRGGVRCRAFDFYAGADKPLSAERVLRVLRKLEVLLMPQPTSHAVPMKEHYATPRGLSRAAFDAELKPLEHHREDGRLLEYLRAPLGASNERQCRLDILGSRMGSSGSARHEMLLRERVADLLRAPAQIDPNPKLLISPLRLLTRL